MKRNELCLCGSGIKYKKCCLLKEKQRSSDMLRDRRGSWTDESMSKERDKFFKQVFDFRKENSNAEKILAERILNEKEKTQERVEGDGRRPSRAGQI